MRTEGLHNAFRIYACGKEIVIEELFFHFSREAEATKLGLYSGLSVYFGSRCVNQ
jgi:hypothetical protein